ncbi:MAG TPA: GNAT family N-acetyltransferase [Candidatus Scatomonas merdigallinarum]|nr:GNAT family N-acetyltransferase [Candidatus Scatomonas merdigallinarum]
MSRLRKAVAGGGRGSLSDGGGCGYCGDPGIGTAAACGSQEGDLKHTAWRKKDTQRQGVATALCEALEQAAGTAVIRTHASLTARGFFEKRGYRLVREQQVERRGVLLTNFVMEKIISGPLPSAHTG